VIKSRGSNFLPPINGNDLSDSVGGVNQAIPQSESNPIQLGFDSNHNNTTLRGQAAKSKSDPRIGLIRLLQRVHGAIARLRTISYRKHDGMCCAPDLRVIRGAGVDEGYWDVTTSGAGSTVGKRVYVGRYSPM